jgi:hypothetical protein
MLRQAERDFLRAGAAQEKFRYGVPEMEYKSFLLRVLTPIGGHCPGRVREQAHGQADRQDGKKEKQG